MSSSEMAEMLGSSASGRDRLRALVDELDRGGYTAAGKRLADDLDASRSIDRSSAKEADLLARVGPASPEPDLDRSGVANQYRIALGRGCYASAFLADDTATPPP
jgi:hypothetical protein